MKTKYFTKNLSLIKPTLAKFAFNHPFDHELLLGWIIVSPMSGFLQWRPHIAITAEAGAGKTTLINITHDLLRPYVPLLLEGTTEAGLRQRIKYDAIPVILDEMDTNNLNEQAFQNIIKLFRVASSAGDVVKGSPSGKSTVFTACFSGLIAGINLPRFSEADESRFCTLELSKRNRTSKWSDLEPEIRSVLNVKTGLELEEYLLNGNNSQSNENENSMMYMKLIQDIMLMTNLIQDFADSRTAQQYGTLLGGLKTLTDPDDYANWSKMIYPHPQGNITGNSFPSEVNQNALDIIARLKSYWKDRRPTDEQGQEVDDSDSAQCKQWLWDLEVGKNDNNTNLHLGTLISSNSAPESKNAQLIGFKMKVVKNNLFVPYSNPKLQKHFHGTKWHNSWVKSLARLEGSKVTTAKLDGLAVKGVMVGPLSQKETIM
jgi:hypothetical protein